MDLEKNLNKEFDQVLEQLSKLFMDLPFNRMLGLQMGEVNSDHITMTFKMKNDLVGNFFYGILHGGVISSVLDMAGGVAVMIGAVQKRAGKSMEELTEVLRKSSTINLHIDYLRPGKGENFTAKAYLVQSGNKISFARMELYNEKSVLIANGTGTYLVG